MVPPEVTEDGRGVPYAPHGADRRTPSRVDTLYTLAPTDNVLGSSARSDEIATLPELSLRSVSAQTLGRGTNGMATEVPIGSRGPQLAECRTGSSVTSELLT